MRFATAFAALALSGLGFAQQEAMPDPMKMLGKPAPELVVDTWANTSGKALKLSALRGKVVVLDYWAYW